MQYCAAADSKPCVSAVDASKWKQSAATCRLGDDGPDDANDDVEAVDGGEDEAAAAAAPADTATGGTWSNEKRNHSKH
jgi:hypothetical protein